MHAAEASTRAENINADLSRKVWRSSALPAHLQHHLTTQQPLQHFAQDGADYSDSGGTIMYAHPSQYPATPPPCQLQRISSVQGPHKTCHREELAHVHNHAFEPELPLTPENMFKMKGAHRPELWEFVRLVRKDEYTHLPDQDLTSDCASGAHCMRCGIGIPYVKGTTSYVTKHMQNVHATHLDQAKQKKAAGAAAKRGSGVALTSEGAYSATLNSSTRAVEDITPEQQAHANKLLAIWIAQSLRPFSTVEDSGLLFYVKYVCEVLGGVRVRLPSRTLVRSYIVDVANTLRVTVKMTILRECVYYSVTTDIWTSRNTDSYMALTLHYVTQDFRFRSWTLEVVSFPGRHSGDAIAKGLTKLFEWWGLDPNFCVKLLRDGASNAVLAGKILQIDHMSCVAHSLHLVLAGALTKRKPTRKKKSKNGNPLPVASNSESRSASFSFGDLPSTTARQTPQESAYQSMLDVNMNLDARFAEVDTENADARFGEDLGNGEDGGAGVGDAAAATTGAANGGEDVTEGARVSHTALNDFEREVIDTFGGVSTGAGVAGLPLLDQSELGEDEIFEADAWLQERYWDELSDFLSEWLVLEERPALDNVRTIVQKFRDIAVYVHKSPKAKKCLDRLQTEELNTSSLKVKIDCPTRWNSARDMLARMVELKNPLALFFQYLSTEEGDREFKDIKLSSPSPEDWFTISCLVTLLDPFAAVTEALSGGYPTLSITLPFLRCINDCLNQTDLFDDIGALEGQHGYVTETKASMNAVRLALRNLFEKRFKKLTPQILWIVLLDPRLTEMACFNEVEKEAAKMKLLEAAVEVAAGLAPPPSDIPSVSTPVAKKSKQVKSGVMALVFGSRASRQATHVVDPTVHKHTLRLQCQDEMDRYLVATAITNDSLEDPLQWWRRNSSLFPVLAVLARKWLGCVSTSVPSERAFSTAGNIVVAKRSALDPGIVRDLIFIHDNYVNELEI